MEIGPRLLRKELVLFAGILRGVVLLDRWHQSRRGAGKEVDELVEHRAHLECVGRKVELIGEFFQIFNYDFGTTFVPIRHCLLSPRGRR